MKQDLMEDGEARGGLAVAATDAEAPPERGAVSGVVATPWTGDDWALVVGSGSDLAELYDQSARLPEGMRFVEAFGDVDLVLVYRPATNPPSRRDLLDSLVKQVVERGGMLVGPVGPDGLSAGERFMTGAEQVAFAAGQADALGALRRALTGTLDPRPGERAVPVAS